MQKTLIGLLLLVGSFPAQAEVSVLLAIGTCEADMPTVCDHGTVFHARLQYKKPLEVVEGLNVVAEFNHLSHKDRGEPDRWFSGDFPGENPSGFIETYTLGLEYVF